MKLKGRKKQNNKLSSRERLRRLTRSKKQPKRWLVRRRRKLLRRRTAESPLNANVSAKLRKSRRMPQKF